MARPSGDPAARRLVFGARPVTPEIIGKQSEGNDEPVSIPFVWLTGPNASRTFKVESDYSEFRTFVDRETALPNYVYSMPGWLVGLFLLLASAGALLSVVGLADKGVDSVIKIWPKLLGHGLHNKELVLNLLRWVGRLL